MAPLPMRPLGSSGIPVSVMSLGSWRTFERISRDQGEAVMRSGTRRGHQLPRRCPVQRRDRQRTDSERLLRGRVRRAVPRQRLGARRGRRRQQAVVGVLAGAVSGRRARCVPRADGARPHRPDLRHAAARHDPRTCHRAGGRRVDGRAHRVGHGASLGGGDVVGAATRRGARHRVRARRAPSGCEPAGLQPRAARERRRSGDRRADGESRCRPRRLVRARRRHADREVHRRRRPAARATTTLRRTAPANGSPSPSPSWRGSGE